MKSIIFTVLEEFVETKYGIEILSNTREKIDAPIFLVDDYPDEIMFSYIATLSEISGDSCDKILFDFGRYIITVFQKVYKTYFLSPNAKKFLMNMDNVHVGATKEIKGARPPRFEYEDPGEDELIMIYKSPRKLCALLKGLINGVADHYNQTVVIEELECMKAGNPRCRLKITFSKQRG
jgi:predicted hydrocarbon binding protein